LNAFLQESVLEIETQGEKCMEWIKFYNGLPGEIRTFIDLNLDNINDLSLIDINDFLSMKIGVCNNEYHYYSAKKDIHVKGVFESNSILLMIWLPGVDDPTLEDLSIELIYDNYSELEKEISL